MEKKTIYFSFVPGDTAYLIYGSEICQVSVTGATVEEYNTPEEYYPTYAVEFWDSDTKISMQKRHALEDLGNDMVPPIHLIASSPVTLAEYLLKYQIFREAFFVEDSEDYKNGILPDSPIKTL